MTSGILTSLKNDEIPWISLKELKSPSFLGNDILSVCKLLCNHLHPLVFDEDWKERVFDRIFIQSDKNALIFVCSALSLEKTESFKRNKLLDLVDKIVYNDPIILLMFHECSIIKQDHTSDNFLNSLINLPSKLGNIMQTKLPMKFSYNQFYSRLLVIVNECLHRAQMRIRREQDTSLEFMASLLGKIVSHGYVNLVWDITISLLVKKCENDHLYRRIAQRVLIKTLGMHEVEQIIKCSIRLMDDEKHMHWILGNVLKESDHISRLFTTKFVNILSFDSNQSVHNLLYYVKISNQKVFIELIRTALASWGSRTSIKYRTQEQSRYLCSLIALSPTYMATTMNAEDLTKLCMKGIESHLGSGDQDLRSINLYAGQSFINHFKPDVALNFDVDEDENVKNFIEKLKQKKDNNLNEATAVKPNVLNKKEGKPTLIEVIDGENNSYYDSTTSSDIEQESVKKPKYIRDCMEGLADNENHEWAYSCLQEVPKLIQKNHFAAKEVAVETCRILLFMVNVCEFPDFGRLRNEAFVSLCLISPIEVATFLCSEFYDSNNAVRNKLDILEVLVMSSQSMTSLKKNDVPSNGFLSLNVMVPSQVVATEQSWQTIIQERLMNKTRKIAHKTKVVEGKANEFAVYAPHFFFPLIDRFEKIDIVYNLREEDHYLLGRLIYSLAIILNAASQAPIAKRMGRVFMRFLWAFRYHSES